jgi:hypothetical protein
MFGKRRRISCDVRPIMDDSHSNQSIGIVLRFLVAANELGEPHKRLI